MNNIAFDDASQVSYLLVVQGTVSSLHTID